MTARGVGNKTKPKAAHSKRGGRRVVSRASLAKRPRASQNKAGRYQAKKAKPDDAPRKAPPKSAPKPAPPRDESLNVGELEQLLETDPDAVPSTDDPPARPPSAAALDLMRLPDGTPWPATWQAAAQKAVDFFERRLRIVKGGAAGQPLILPWWLEEIIREAYGPLNEKGFRIVRTVYLEVASKNAKSTVIGGAGLYHLAEDGEAGAEVYCFAKNRKQARNVFNSARAMALASPYLNGEKGGKLTIFRHALEHATDQLAKFEPMSSDAGTVDGVDPQCVIIDELHRIKDREIVDMLGAKMASRRQPMMFMITTAGEWDPDSIAWEKHCYALGIIDGTIKDPTWVARIYTVPLDADWKDESYWHLANPNLGISVTIESLRAEFREALKSPQKERSFRRLHLNQWLSGETKALDMKDWDACGVEPIDVKALQKERALCCAGLDLSSTRDLTAFVLVFPRPDGTFIVIAKCFMPADRLEEHVDGDEKPYDVWHQQGWLELTSGNVIDFTAIRCAVEEAFATFRLKELAFDRAGAAHMTQELDLAIGSQSGLPDDEQLKVIPFGQGFFSMSEPTKDFFDLVRAKRIRHGDNPLLRWQVDCCVTAQDPAGNVRLVKPDRRKHKKRIDAAVALVMGLARAKMMQVLEDAGVSRSVYEDRGVRTL